MRGEGRRDKGGGREDPRGVHKGGSTWTGRGDESGRRSVDYNSLLHEAHLPTLVLWPREEADDVVTLAWLVRAPRHLHGRANGRFERAVGIRSFNTWVAV